MMSNAQMDKKSSEIEKTCLFQGQLVRLAAVSPERDSKLFARWARDSEYLRMLDTGPVRQWSEKQYKKWFKEDLEKDNRDEFFFLIRTLEGDDVIGFIDLDGVKWHHGDAFVGIGIGEREYWSKGYGADAMNVMLRFAFDELNLHRVSLNVFEYNQRAIRSYQKVGFVIEGRERQFLRRAGRRWDMIFMGILRAEWEARNRA
jgi:RimJ/RimL family protein N-acetyltransferase